MRRLLLSNIPPEVILQIFRYADDFSTANALLRTSSVFHCIWLLNANAIAVSILPRAVRYYAEARVLVHAYEQEAKLSQVYDGGPRSHREAIIVHVRRFLSASDLLFNFYENSILPNLKLPGGTSSYMPLDRDRALPALYRLKTLAISCHNPQIESPALESITKPELIDMCEVISWLRRKCPLETQEELGLQELIAQSKWLQNWFDRHLAQLRNQE